MSLPAWICRIRCARAVALMQVAVAIGACQSTLPSGTPIHITRSVEGYFNQYKNGWGPNEFWLSRDGRYAHWNYCRAGASACVSVGPSVQSACEARSGQPCGIFAKDGQIVWDGPVTFESKGEKPASPVAAASPSVASAPSAPVQVKFDVIWPGQDNALSGWAERSAGSSKGQIWFRDSLRRLNCVGEVVFTVPSGWTGQWWVKCENSTEASGTLADLPGVPVSGQGLDGRGRSVTLRPAASS